MRFSVDAGSRCAPQPLHSVAPGWHPMWICDDLAAGAWRAESPEYRSGVVCKKYVVDAQ